jgi:LysM repeat protein
VLAAIDYRGEAVGLLDPPAPRQVVSPQTAFLITDMLSDTVARLPAFNTNNPLELSVPAAAKTGTTSDYRDNWTVGFTKYLVTGVWAGNNRGAPMRNSSGITGAAPIWNAFMEAVLADPDMLARLGVPVAGAEEDTGEAAGEAAGEDTGEEVGPDNPAADEQSPDIWAFDPPDGVAQVDVCPPKMACREGGEFFSQQWLDAAGELGPLADSVAAVETVPLYPFLGGYAWVPVYCQDPYAESGEVRSVLRLGNSLGLPDSEAVPPPPPPEPTTQISDDGSLIYIPPAPESAFAAQFEPESADYRLTLYSDDELERFRTLDWAIRYNVPVSLDYCANLSIYTVNSGDNWSVIGRRVNLPYPALQAINPQAVRESGILRVGDRLLVPSRTVYEYQDIGIRHQVVEGDSWGVIATRYDVPVQVLQQANPRLVRAFSILRLDDELIIPVRVDSRSATLP